MFSGEHILSSPSIRNTWRTTEQQMDLQVSHNQKERYEQIVQTAWQNYYQNVQPQVKEELERIEKRCQALAKQINANTSISEPYTEQYNEIIEDLICTCMQLAQPARRLGNLTGQTNYFYLWKTLWAEVLEQNGEILSQQMHPFLPMLYGDWHLDSILKRSFDRVTQKKRSLAR